MNSPQPDTPHTAASPPARRHALVIGAGLAGAAVCAALARRGWTLELLDAADGPAAGASALPVGMLSPHVTRAPTPLSRLSALGVADTRAELERLVPQGAGWQAGEVDNRGHDPGRWPCALVRPAALVQAWLAEAKARTSVREHWACHVDRLGFDGEWRALDSEGRCMAHAPVAVVACAWPSLDLLRHSLDTLEASALPLRPVQGQMSLGALEGDALAERAQRDNGVFVPAYADSGLPPRWPARIWTMGSTYERGATQTDVRASAHTRNAESLQALNAPAAEHLRQELAAGRLLGWAQVRCASLDRLPLAGAVPDTAAWQALLAPGTGQRRRPPLNALPRVPGLHLLTALGSRGLTLAHWCAERVAEGIAGERLNGEADLLAAIDPARFAWRQARKQG